MMSEHNESDNMSFFEAMKDVRPLKQNDKALHNSPGKTDSLAKQLKRAALEYNPPGDGNYLSVEKVTPVDPYDFLGYKKDGVQEGVYKKLRLGQYQIETVLNLQQRSFEQARTALFDTIQQCYKVGIRTLLIQHGLGIHSKPFAGFRKSYVNQWLPQMPEVLAFHSALKCHGGVAAVYVLLKKNSEERLANRERHRKR